MPMRACNRPWPTPREPWIMKQTWENLMFAHWRIDPAQLRRIVPAELEIDTFDGSGWVAVAPFMISNIRWRGLPHVPGAAAFPEINVRTYVIAGGKPGVFFFSLDAASRLAVEGARMTFGLPYFLCDARIDPVQEGIHYRSTRTDPRGAPATFHGEYRPTSTVFNAQPGSFEYYLTERYCLYSLRWGGSIWRSEIDHAPWPLQTAEADFRINTMARAAGLNLPEQEPVLHFARYLDVKAWWIKRVPAEELLTQPSSTPASR